MRCASNQSDCFSWPQSFAIAANATCCHHRELCTPVAVVSPAAVASPHIGRPGFALLFHTRRLRRSFGQLPRQADGCRVTSGCVLMFGILTFTPCVVATAGPQDVPTTNRGVPDSYAAWSPGTVSGFPGDRPQYRPSECAGRGFGRWHAGLREPPDFRLRRFQFTPADFSCPPRPDGPVARTWIFRDAWCGNVVWEQTECDQQTLPEYFYRPAWQVSGDLLQDNRSFYSRQSLLCLGGTVGVAAIFANTDIDENFRSWMHRQKLTEPAVDCWFRDFGNGYYTISATAAALLLSHAWKYGRYGRPTPLADGVEDWSYRSMRAFFVGAPSVLVIQQLTGSSRPGESSAGSDWVPFADNNGVSGHAFVGAVPFLAAAKMTDRPLVKGALLVGSGMGAYGRLCDDGHYLSQVLLGWSIACLSVEAVTATEQSRERYRFVPLSIRGYHGLGIEFRR